MTLPDKHMETARAVFHEAIKGPAGQEVAIIARALADAYREGMRRASEIAEERAEWVPLRPGDMRKAILCATAAPTP